MHTENISVGKTTHKYKYLNINNHEYGSYRLIVDIATRDKI